MAQLRLVVYPVICKVLYVPSGSRWTRISEPSTVDVQYPNASCMVYQPKHEWLICMVNVAKKTIHWFGRSSILFNTVYPRSPSRLFFEWSFRKDHCSKDLHQGKSRRHSYHVLVYISPVLTHLLGTVPCTLTMGHNQQFRRDYRD